MSAWMTGKAHRDLIVTKAVDLGLVDREQANALGEILTLENVRSLRARYRDPDDAMITTLDKLQTLDGDGAKVTLAGDYILRLRISGDEFMTIDDFEDFYGRVTPQNKRDSRRPEGFNGRARKITNPSGTYWWQPPADVADDQLAELKRSVAQLIEYGFISVTLELIQGQDGYGRPIVREHVSTFGVEWDASPSDIARIACDLFEELGAGDEE